MQNIISRTISHPAWSLCSAVIWGVLEFIALHRPRFGGFRSHHEH